MNLFNKSLLTATLLSCAVVSVSCSGNLGTDDPNADNPGGGGQIQELSVPYVKKSLFMDFTSTGCTNCPDMAKALDALSQEHPGKFSTVAMHCHYGSFGDAMTIKFTDTYMKKFDIVGLPCGLINLRPTQIKAIKGDIEKAILAENDLKPDCGVALETSFDKSTRDITATIKITSNKSKTYRYLIIITEDGINTPQMGVEGEYIHNHVARDILSNNIFGERLNLANPVEPGKEYTATKQLKSLSPNFVESKMKVIGVALSSDDNGVTWVCENVNECALGDKVDYSIEK